MRDREHKLEIEAYGDEKSLVEFAKILNLIHHAAISGNTSTLTVNITGHPRMPIRFTVNGENYPSELDPDINPNLLPVIDIEPEEEKYNDYYDENGYKL